MTALKQSQDAASEREAALSAQLEKAKEQLEQSGLIAEQLGAAEQ